ncbi:hypothetical protein PFISCL1PPCAC_6485 [Pristionchus fissidentatus]|uniref:Peptidase M20 dimerisation domain-containing protein n=1 Tax=Pristionchus fissidentatus TaxID=1538716 RepID=A0AAV5VAB1_9BILA|nr:hypothetical protein PFISCL1PPCAC_6485 [Pristionchus fissidentatus]
MFSYFVYLTISSISTGLTSSSACNAHSQAMPVPESAYEKVYAAIDSAADSFVARLAEAVAIPSVSAEPKRRPDVKRMCEWAEKALQKLGATTEMIDPGLQKTPTGDIPLPPIVFGTLGTNKNKKTVLVYGHLDVQPAEKSDGWNTEPFVLTEVDGKMFGRGSTDDKGPVIAWINAIETLQKVGVELPVNVKFVFEGMEESGSEGLEAVLTKRRGDFLSDVDFVCISDNYWLGKKKPCLTYGLRGICYYTLEVQGAKQDLHSGSFGGSVHEAMNDLVWIMSKLTDVKGKILIPGISEQVSKPTAEENATYTAIDFDKEEYRNDVGAYNLTAETKEEVLMNRWRYPSLSLHGIEGAFSQSGAKTVIPAKVIGKFSIRTVPDMTPTATDAAVLKFLNELWATRGSPNKFNPVAHHSGKPWVTDCKDVHFQAGARAIKRVFGVEPDYTREGGSIPITLVFQELTGKNVMMLPIGQSDDMAHSQNEKISRHNYIQGAKVLASYLLELGSQ